MTTYAKEATATIKRNASDYSGHISAMGWGKSMAIVTRACHSQFSTIVSGSHDRFFQIVPHKTEAQRHFMDWVISEDSYYYPLIKHLGKRFIVVRNDDGHQTGWIFEDVGDVNVLLMMNFCKSMRIYSEHAGSCGGFWDKWAIEHDVKNKKLVYALAPFWNKSGQSQAIGHNYLNGGSTYDFVKERFLSSNHGTWDFTRYTTSDINNYTGEEKEAFAFDSKHGKKGTRWSPRQDIVYVEQDVRDTHFVRKYRIEKVKSVADKDFLELFNNFK